MKFIVGGVLLAALITGLAVAFYLVQQPTNLTPKAQDTGGACQPPAAVSNVKVEYPSCQ
jgi:hypothetical protein